MTVNKPERFPYCDANRFPDLNDVLPHLPMRLTSESDESLSVMGMLDTGSAVRMPGMRAAHYRRKRLAQSPYEVESIWRK